MTERPKLQVIDGGKPTPHVCHNKRGGRRCDICFGPVSQDYGTATFAITIAVVVLVICAACVVKVWP